MMNTYLLTAAALIGVSAWVSAPFIILGFLTALYFALVNIVPAMFEKRVNTVRQPPPYRVTPDAQALHQRLLVADLHADTLLWNRDLLKTGKTGQADIPRMQEGNIAFQVFGVVTRTPKGMNFEVNPANAFDNITMLAVLSGWPTRTWTSLFERAVYQAAKLRYFEQHSNGALMRVLDQQDLALFLERRRDGQKIVGGFASLEGVHALEGKLDNLDLLHKAGFRMIGLTHFFDNEAGGSAHGLDKSGLTDFGRAVVHRTEELHMVLDLAHASPCMIDDTLAITSTPLVVSHTGVRGTCDNVRNLSDAHVHGIARTGGVVGIAMFDQAVGETSVAATARAMRYTASLVGVEHVALGCDFDGVIAAPIDYRGMALLTEALLKEGFSAAEIEQIMGWNFMRVLMAVLPE